MDPENIEGWISSIRSELASTGVLSLTDLVKLRTNSDLVHVLERSFSLPLTGKLDSFLDHCRRWRYTRQCLAYINPNRCLEEAASIGDLEIIERSILRGATFLNSALLHAAGKGQLAAVDLLIKRGAIELYWAMLCAIHGKHPDIINFLFTKWDKSKFNYREASRRASRRQVAAGLYRYVK